MTAPRPRRSCVSKLLLAGAALLAAGTAGPAHAQAGYVDLVATHEGSSDELRVLVDASEPVLEITSPAYGSVIAGNSVTISGTAEDPFHDPPPDRTPLFQEVTWRVVDENFVPIGFGTAPVVEGRFTIADVVLGTGTHYVVVEAVDSAGNTAAAEVGVTSDPDAPPVALVGIQDGEAVLTSSIPIDLNFAAPTTLVSVNGAPDGRAFPAGLALDVLTLPLALGANTVTLVLDGGTGPFSFSFTIFRVESAGPIRIVSPPDGSFTNQAAITVTGTMPRGTPLVQVNGRVAAIAPDGVTFTAPLTLAEGSNEIRALAFPFGQQASVRVGLDTVPPEIVELFPDDGTFTVDAAVPFAGFVSERASIEAVGPGGSARADARAEILSLGNPLLGIPSLIQWVFELPELELVDGANAVELRLVDRAGNETVETVSITRSDSALVLQSPADGSVVPNLRTDVTLQVLADVTLESVFSAGRLLTGFGGLQLSTGPLGAPGLFTLGGVPLAPGPTEIRLVYRRDAGGQQEVLRFAVECTSPNAATVTGTVTDGATGGLVEGALVSVFVNGLEYVAPTGPDGRFSVTVEPGDVVVSVTREGFLEYQLSGSVVVGGTLIADARLLPWSTPTTPVPPPPPGDPEEPITTLGGIATDASTSQPLAGVLVLVTADGASFSAITGATGIYGIAGIPSGELTVDVALPGYFPQSFALTTAGQVVASLDVELQPIPDTVAVAGVVTSRLTGLPEPGVEIVVLGTDVATQTDASGGYLLLGVPTGTQTLRLRKGGFSDRYFTFDDLAPRPDGRPVFQDLEYPSAVDDFTTIAVAPDALGSVVDQFSGAPLAGAVVTVDGESVQADAAGRFVFPGLPPLTFVTFAAEAPDHEPQSITALVVVNGQDELRFALRPTTRGFVSGRISDAATGLPVSAAEVRVPDGPLLATATDADGDYQLVGVPAGAHPLEVAHPEYLPALVSAVVADGGGTTVDVALAPRPRTGALEGTVTDAAGGAPIGGAVLTGPGGASSTTDADGRYRLEGLPAGLVTLAIEAPAFAATTRTTSVAADRDPATPSVTRSDFALHVDGSVPDEVTRLVSVAAGGVVETPDRRLSVLIPPGSLSGDARITLQRPAAPPLANGAPLALDPALGLDSIEAVGEATELLVEAPVDGDVAPQLVGPIAIVARFSEQARAAANVSEDALFPYYFDGTSWTALRIVPHLHAVDRIDNVVFVAVDSSTTETGAPVVAGFTTPRPILLAQAGGDPPDFKLVRKFLLQLASRALEALGDEDIDPTAAYIDFQGGSIDPNALPLFVVHGWSAEAILGDVDLMRAPLADARYGQILQDLMAGTDGVYRPIFLTYNSRLSPLVSGNLLGSRLKGPLLTGGIEGLPSPDDPNSGRFSFVNSFGFSMGGLVERSVACFVPEIRDMVSMGSPHHGALQRLEAIVKILGAALDMPLDFDQLLRTWSPGTAALLDYESHTDNPTLFTMNESLACTTPRGTMGLIGGTQSGIIDDLFLVGEKPNDKIVPLRSAHARSKSGYTIPVLAGFGSERLLKLDENFNHNDVGKASQPISQFADRDIFPVLSDWTVSKLERFDILPEDPEPDEPQTVEAEVTVGFNVPHETVTGMALLLYRKDGNDQWHVIAGADPSSLEVTDVEPISGNSRTQRTTPLSLTAQADLPLHEPGMPETETKDLRLIVFQVKDGETTVPPEPRANFGLP